jgi:hypothetical protein
MRTDDLGLWREKEERRRRRRRAKNMGKGTMDFAACGRLGTSHFLWSSYMCYGR